MRMSAVSAASAVSATCHEHNNAREPTKSQAVREHGCPAFHNERQDGPSTSEKQLRDGPANVTGAASGGVRGSGANAPADPIRHCGHGTGTDSSRDETTRIAFTLKVSALVWPTRNTTRLVLFG